MEELKVDAKNKKSLKLALVLLVIVLASVLAYISLNNDKATAPTSNNSAPKTTLAEPKLQLSLFATGLTDPTAIVSTKQPNDKRLFILDRAGIIRIVDGNGKVSPEPFLDISSQVLAKGEMGLLGLVFSPKHAQDGYFFINYVDKGQNTIIARYHASGNAGKADPASGQTVLSVKQPYVNHNGGDLLFGKDGYLYAALGDGGSAGDPENRAQNLDSLFGKILRLDVSTLPYKIPADNPFANQTGKKGEIWDYGLRNPWRISFDKTTHDFYIADVGQGEIEEVNLEKNGSKGGMNYGWRCYEGTKDFMTQGCLAKDKYVPPAFEYNHSEKRCSITGGYVYRGHKYPALNRQYLYGDFCTGEVFWAEQKADKWEQTLVAKTPYQISTFGEDTDGEIYMADFKTGSIYQIQDSAN